jgi:integrin beta 2
VFIFWFVFSVPEGDPPSIVVYSSTGDIQRIHLNGSSYAGISSVTPVQTSALEFNHRNRSLCFIHQKSNHAKLSCANIDNLNESWDLPTPSMFSLNCKCSSCFKVLVEMNDISYTVSEIENLVHSSLLI